MDAHFFWFYYNRQIGKTTYLCHTMMVWNWHTNISAFIEPITLPISEKKNLILANPHFCVQFHFRLRFSIQSIIKELNVEVQGIKIRSADCYSWFYHQTLNLSRLVSYKMFYLLLQIVCLFSSVRHYLYSGQRQAAQL